MNKVFLIGNLTHDPELTETAAGIAVCRFSIAVNRRTSDGERETDFFNITAWRGTGENIARYCRKGQKICVVGTIQMRPYEDREGIKRVAVDIVAQEVEFLAQRARDNDGQGNETATARSGTKPKLQPFNDDGDIPF